MSAENVKYYDIDWDNVKTIKDIKLLLSVMATQLVIDHTDASDIIVYEKMKSMLIEIKED
jgi:hypothetical protein